MALQGTNQELARPYNRRIVLEAIRQHGPLARGDIAERVGLTVQTVSTITRELEDSGFILGTRDARRTRGYPSTNLSINPDGGYAIGLNLTPRGLSAALVNLGGDVVARDDREETQASPDAGFKAIAAVVKEFKRRRQGRRMLGAGLAMPGPFDVESMSFVGPTTLENWKNVAIAERLRKSTGLPSFIEVDHAAAALGERIYGAGRAFRSFYYLYLSVGLGGCMVHDGHPLRGSFNNAGEIGHMPLVAGGEPCACGNHGCLERYVSAEAFERLRKSAGQEGWLAAAAPVLRAAIAIIENLYDPETIIIGGVANDVPLGSLIERAEPLLNSVSARKDRKVPRLILSAAGSDAVLKGAAALAVTGVLSPQLGLRLIEPESLRDPMFNPKEAA